ncbi:recombination protein RecR [Clostridia bacterium]|nr:recombination protein RecR [Clostridia bacterium]
MNAIEPIAKLANQFSRLPGVGGKTALRYAYRVVEMSDADAEDFVAAVRDVKENVAYCGVCGNFTEKDRNPCAICAGRDHGIVCVVKEPKDVLALEKVRDYGGVYHVLHGTISPLDGRGPDDIRIKELVRRVGGGEVREVIMATNPDVEGEATAFYIARLLKPLGVKVTRIAQGISMGSDIEYADEVTLSRALEDRREI